MLEGSGLAISSFGAKKSNPDRCFSGEGDGHYLPEQCRYRVVRQWAPVALHYLPQHLCFPLRPVIITAVVTGFQVGDLLCDTDPLIEQIVYLHIDRIDEIPVFFDVVVFSHYPASTMDILEIIHVLNQRIDPLFRNCIVNTGAQATYGSVPPEPDQSFPIGLLHEQRFHFRRGHME